MIFVIGLAIIIIDQIVKAIVSISIPYGETIGELIKISNVSNTGIAYSMRTR